MVNDVIAGISVAINAEFDDGYLIYKEKVEQGFQTPCFYIKCLSPNRKKISIKMYLDNLDFDIHYFPSTANVREECYSVGYKLLDLLEQITLLDNTMLIGKSMSFSITDDVLHFLVSYKPIMKAVKETVDLMETVNSQIKEK